MEGILCAAILVVILILFCKGSITINISHTYKQELPPVSPEVEARLQKQAKAADEFYEQQKKMAGDIANSINEIMGVNIEDGRQKDDA